MIRGCVFAVTRPEGLGQKDVEVHIVRYAGPDGSELIAAWYTDEQAQIHREKIRKAGKVIYDTNNLHVEALRVRGRAPEVSL
jgi:hypothetical protein